MTQYGVVGLDSVVPEFEQALCEQGTGEEGGGGGGGGGGPVNGEHLDPGYVIHTDILPIIMLSVTTA